MRVLAVSRHLAGPARMGRSAAFARLVGRLDEALEVRRVQGHVGGGDLPPRTLGVDLSGRGTVAAAFAMWRAVGEAVRGFRPDVVLTDGLDLPPVRAPVVAVVRDLVGTGWDVVGGNRGWRVRARRCAALVVPHDLVRRDLVSVGVDPFRVTVIPELVDVPARPLPPPDARDGVVTLLHPGAIHPAKGQHLSIDAVSRLGADDKARIHLVVAGPATNPRYLAQLKVAASGQPVTFVTEETSRTWPELLASCRVVLYPTSLDEGCPDAALFAMAHGLAVLAPDRPTLRDQLGPGAVLLPPGHVTALRDTLADVLAGRLDPVPIGRRGATFVAERHGWPAVWQRYRTLLAAVTR